MKFNYDFNKNLNDRAKAEAEIKDYSRKERDRMEIPEESKRDHVDFSYKAQRRSQIKDKIVGILSILLLLYLVYWFLRNIF